jgi:hypothetical protein
MYSHSNFYPLSPYFLKDDKGRIMENIWQFSKCYEQVPKTIQKKSRYSNTVIWSHNKEIHLDKDGNTTEEYLKWRLKGMHCKHPVRYPVGFNYRSMCKFALQENDDGTINNTKLNYIEARKAIYLPVYCNLVRMEALFHELQARLNSGENLLIIEVDGPHQESMDYYKNMYKVEDNFIENDTMLVNDRNIDIMLNDDKHAFGHGYCLAMALLNMDR